MTIPTTRGLWQLVNRINGNRYDAYQSKTARPIPLVVLDAGERLGRGPAWRALLGERARALACVVACRAPAG